MYFGTFKNSNTKVTPRHAQKAKHRVSRDLNPPENVPGLLAGHGKTDDPLMRNFF
eukprot:TRINITY_DN319_c0_g1_i5.p2 TRINITY_DN319_c0_g1~~TRINITY_DN319_c0_g1_i5.p2  ORF type:complete len:55 (+),score=8.94 TRINITY_DN319_c0_g1_i5:178-342(+)